MKGWVYVISNKAMPELIKVGYSMKDPELRAMELDHSGSPHPYVVEYDMLVENPQQIEQKVHRTLSRYREGKEWFRCTLEKAIYAIRSVAGGRAISESITTPVSDEKIKALVLIDKGKLFEVSGQYQEALHYYKEARKMSPYVPAEGLIYELEKKMREEQKRKGIKSKE